MEPMMAKPKNNTDTVKAVGFAVAIVVAGVVSVLFWAHVWLALAILVPVAIIVSVIRSAYRDLTGRRVKYTFGALRLSDIPKKPSRIRHFLHGTDDE